MATWKKVVVSGSDISQLNNDAGFIASVGGGIISSSAEGSAQGTLALNGIDVDVNGMQTGDSPTFVTVTSNLTGDVTGNVTGNVTGDVTGDLTGNADTATALETARTIGGVSFDGSANINLPGVNTAGNQDTSGNADTATSLETSRNFSISGDATSPSIAFDGGGNVNLNVSLGNNVVDTAEIANGAVTNDKLAGSITNAKLSNSAITIAGQLTALGETITADTIIGQVSAGEILSTQLEEDAITIGSTSVDLGATASTVADLTLTGAVGSGSFSGSFEGDGSGLTGVIAEAANSLTNGNGISDFSYNGSSAVTVSVEADGSTLTVGGSGVKVSNLGIDTAQLANDAVTNAKIAVGAVGALEIGDEQVTNAKLADDAVGTDEIADDAVTAAKIATNAVTADAIAPNSVALGTDTTGNYVATLGSGTGVTIGSNTGEGSTPTIAVNYGTTANTAAEGDVTLAVAGTANEIVVTNGAASAIGANRSITVGLPDDVVISGDLTVLGTASFAEETNLTIADRFILLASGSTSTGDGGIVVQQTTQDVGEVFAFEDNDERWGVATAFNASGNTVTFDAFMAAATSAAGANPNTVSPGARYDAAGNIYTSTGDESIWIYS